MTLVLTIVRHGNTFASGEPSRRIGARTDLPLVEGGEVQADALGHFFLGEGAAFDRVLTSPLRRTRRTAELILAEMVPAPAVETCSWLAEIDHGPDENQPEDRVLARLGGEALARWNEALVAPSGWTVDAPARLAAWRALLASETGHLLLVTSAGAARFGLQAAGLPLARLRTGAWGRITVGQDKARIEAWDRRPSDAA